jgi:hypothetical protein
MKFSHGSDTPLASAGPNQGERDPQRSVPRGFAVPPRKAGKEAQAKEPTILLVHSSFSPSYESPFEMKVKDTRWTSIS